jgi:hypothetical protein
VSFFGVVGREHERVVVGTGIDDGGVGIVGNVWVGG